MGASHKAGCEVRAQRHQPRLPFTMAQPALLTTWGLGSAQLCSRALGGPGQITVSQRPLGLAPLLCSSY